MVGEVWRKDRMLRGWRAKIRWRVGSWSYSVGCGQEMQADHRRRSKKGGQPAKISGGDG
jgi:hypothetical protein